MPNKEQVNKFEELFYSIPKYARDIQVNIRTVLNPDNAPLDQKLLIGIALAAGYAARNSKVEEALLETAESLLDAKTLGAIKSANAIMAMSNMYHRFTSLVSDAEYAKLPIGLRMNVVGDYGIEKREFELYSLAISVVNGCRVSIDTHERSLKKEGVRREQIQHVAKIASVIYALSRVIEMDNSANL
ncbi:MAG: alkyl hydroperoxide reductase [Rickettsiales bacterium]|jgi:lipoyl-dependent peroxiredoxin subunit D|nr:alkyl hydroperoxide reductase [Rickettsiales bacterium]